MDNMKSQAVRDEVLSRLKTAAPKPSFMRDAKLPAPKPDDPKELFCLNLAMQGVVLHRSSDEETFCAQLSEVVASEGISRLVVSRNEGFPKEIFDAWANDQGITWKSATDKGCDYRDAVFQWADAGLTMVDSAAAETGSMLLVHDNAQPRMVSLVPEIHLAIVNAATICRAPAEPVKKHLLKEGRPSQVTFISAPSLTADIRATPFYGMHGPKKVFVFLRE